MYTMLKAQLTLLMHCNLLEKEHPASCLITPRGAADGWIGALGFMPLANFYSSLFWTQTGGLCYRRGNNLNSEQE